MLLDFFYLTVNSTSQNINVKDLMFFKLNRRVNIPPSLGTPQSTWYQITKPAPELTSIWVASFHRRSIKTS